MNKKRLTMLLSALFFAAPAFATTYYVSPTGNDAGAGSSTAPWKTLQKAANTVVAGDTVIVRAGNYAGFGYAGPGGSAASPITFSAEANVLINAPATGGPNPGLNAINVEPSGGQTGHIIIKGFSIRGGFDKAGIRLVDADGCQVLDNDIQNTGGEWGIFTNNASNSEFARNRAHDSVGQHGIYLGHSKTCWVHHNQFYGNNWDGIHVNAGVDFPSSGHVIENNVIYGNALSGMDLEGLQDGVIRNNLIYGNGKHGLTLHNEDDVTWSPAVVFPNKNNVIANNTIFDNAMFGIQMQSGGNTANTIVDNVLVPSQGSGYGSIGINGAATGLICDYNIMVDRLSTNVGGSEITLAQWRTATGQDAHSFIATGAQMFVNAAANDYHLKSGSPAIDAGRTYPEMLNADFDGHGRLQGSAVDIGAYEFGNAPANPPGSNPPGGNPPSNNSAAAAAHDWLLSPGQSATISCSGGSPSVYSREGKVVDRLSDAGSGAYLMDGRGDGGAYLASGRYVVVCPDGARTKVIWVK